MTGYGNLKAGTLTLYDQSGTDINALSRLRISEPTSVFSFDHVYDKNARLFQESIGSNAASTFDSRSLVSLAVTGAGGRVVRQSYAYVPFTSGSCQLVLLNGVLTTTLSTNTYVRARIGCFDDYADKTNDSGCGNGFFFQLLGGSLSVVWRTSTGGYTQSDTVVSQSSFSLDKMDGSGSSGFTFSASVAQTFVIELSDGLVRMGVKYAQDVVYCHSFSRKSSVPLVKYMSLPVRFEICNTSSSVSQTDAMYVLSGAVYSEGVLLRRQRNFSYNTGSSGVTVSSTSRTPVFSLRLQSTAPRATLLLQRLQLMTDIQSLWEVVYGGTLTSASFSSPDTNAVAEIDTSATAITGGTLLRSAYLDRRTELSFDAESENYITSDMSGSSLILSVCCSAISESVAGFLSVQWREFV